MAGMMTGLLLLLLAGVAVGRVLDLQKRIYGGTACGATERLYHVKLIRRNGTRSSPCGGSLISDQWILTAAHCVLPGWTMTAFLRVHPGDKNKTFDIERVEIYEKDQVKHDIALLKVKAPEKGYEYVTLPQCDQKKRPVGGDVVQIAGHGPTGRNDANTDANGLSKTLQCANTDVVKCLGGGCLSGYYADPKKVFCYQRAAVDTRPGDSGGGVMFNNMIYGVHIRGFDKACTGPSVAMNVCDDEYKVWIERVAGLTFP